jgi:hypothetical protein
MYSTRHSNEKKKIQKLFHNSMNLGKILDHVSVAMAVKYLKYGQPELSLKYAVDFEHLVQKRSVSLF